MNTEDFKSFEFKGIESAFQDIFKKQKLVFEKYMEFEPNKIEDFDINCYSDQQILKDFLQIRFIEELTEASEDPDNKDHFLEEIVDALNFLVEAYIIYGWDFDNLGWHNFTIDGNPCSCHRFWKVTESVGLACNLLKNRPWKQTQYLVDLPTFEERLKKIWIQFNYLCNHLKINVKTLYTVWSQKYQVNEFRIRSAY